MTHTLILANGFAPKISLFAGMRENADFFVCADGGANTALKFHAKPNLIIGDFDSVKQETLDAFRSVQKIRMTDQNSTDLEKAFSEVLRRGRKSIIVLGAMGGRLDHAIGNLSALVKFSPFADISFFDETGFYFSIPGTCALNLPPDTIVSLIPLALCSGITTTGLRWNLSNESLQLGIRESTSNRTISTHVTISVGRGNLIAYIQYPRKIKR